MRIGELARRTGVEAGTLRAWERRFGLLTPTRTPGGQRQYSEEDVARVLTVRRLIDEGLTLASAAARVVSAGDGGPPNEPESRVLQQILQNLTLGVLVGKDARTIYANRRMAEMLRSTVEELLATNLLSFIPEEDLSSAREHLAGLRHGIAFVFDGRLRRADGTTFDAESHVRPVFDRAGRYEGSVAIVSDVTKRKAAEAEHRFRSALLDAVGEAVTASDNNGVITYVNNAAVALTGWPVEEFVGRHIDSFPTASRESHEHLEEIRARVSAGERFSGEVPVVRRDGSTSTCQLISTPLFGTDGEPVGRINLLHDLSEQRHIDEELHTRDLRASAVAVLGARAVAKGTDSSSSDDTLLHEIVEATRRLLGADRATVTEVGGDGKLVVRATSPEGGPVTVPSGSRSLAGYTMLARSVVVVEDVTSERRFDTTSFTGGTRSAVAAPVFGSGGSRGAVTAECTGVRSFDRSATDFMQAIANVVAAARK
ncbi:MAG TPA: PAS domain S-box protein [Acidimicrobiales bacterium]|nr:PAS domain S-box protein [Acidimicrobiales bacterium]